MGMVWKLIKKKQTNYTKKLLGRANKNEKQTISPKDTVCFIVLNIVIVFYFPVIFSDKAFSLWFFQLRTAASLLVLA